MLRTLENVEGMALEALRAGLGPDWPFEGFPSYLDAVAARGVAVNVGALVGHTALRTYAMGEDAVAREATADEVVAMRRLVDEALEAGALGFATSKAPTHVGYGGHPVPSRAASVDAEILELAGALGAAGRGVFQATIGPGLFLDQFETIARRTGRPVSWTALLAGIFGPEGHRLFLERCRKLQEEGAPVHPQVTGRPLMMEFALKAPFPLESLPCMKPVSAADREGKKALYADPDFRRALREEIDQGVFTKRWRSMRLSAFPPDPSLEERPLEELAEARGADPLDALLDLSLESDLEARFRLAATNVDEEIVAELLVHPAAMLGLSDAGAHASQLCDAGASTHLLGHWVREKGVLPLEEAVRKLTTEPAEVFGIRDRGRLAEGLAADLCVFDPDTVACGPLRRVWDLPGGADRLVADALGVRAVVVNGVPVREQGRDAVAPDGALPGRVLRGGAAS